MKLMTKELAAKIPALYSQDGKGYDAMAQAHYFIGGCDWYVSEFDPEQGLFFGWAVLNGDIEMAELGYVSLAELESVRTPFGGVERDLYWTPKTLKECREECEKKYGGRG